MPVPGGVAEIQGASSAAQAEHWPARSALYARAVPSARLRFAPPGCGIPAGGWRALGRSSRGNSGRPSPRRRLRLRGGPPSLEWNWLASYQCLRARRGADRPLRVGGGDVVLEAEAEGGQPRVGAV